VNKDDMRDLAIVAGITIAVAWGQRQVQSVTFADWVHRIAARLHPAVEPELPADVLRDLYDSTR
jgi:hypothetical protein